VWPLEPGTSSSYEVYDDSGVAVEYQTGVFARTPIKATQSGDTLRVEIGPVAGSYPGMLHARAYELRLPADWPPASVTINGLAVSRKLGVTGNGGWSFEGNTLTTIVPVPTRSVAAKVTVEVRRTAGLTARRGELDGFAGAMTRLRGVYDSLQQTWPVAAAPDLLIDAMQTGDRLSYHPELATEEITHFHSVLFQAQGSVQALGATFAQHLNDITKRISANSMSPAELAAQKQRRLDALSRAEKLVTEVDK
jgi:alpha-glucosidase